MSKLHPFMQQLQAQAADRLNFPNIPTQGFDSVKRSLQKYMQQTYGVRVLNPTALQSGEGVKVDFLVLAVNGVLGASAPNLARDVIYLANQNFAPPEKTELTLWTPNNLGVKCLVKQSLGNGAIAVTVVSGKGLTEDILSINSKKVNGGSPYVSYVGKFKLKLS